jgi:hypothetical protein
VAVLIGAVSGGYMQLFFGDVENYTVSAAIVVFYVLAAHRYLSGEVGLHVPSAILAVAMCFHLETGCAALVALPGMGGGGVGPGPMPWRAARRWGWRSARQRSRISISMACPIMAVAFEPDRSRVQ